MTQRKGRSEKAEATRGRVVDRARDLFLSQGYAATSTRQIAAEAGVTERTLFNIVPSKGALLQQVMLAHVFDGHSGPFLERPDLRPVIACRSPDEFLNRFAGWVTRLHERTGALAEVIRAAASVDAGAADLWAAGTLQQATDCGQIVDLFHGRGWLRSGVLRAQAADSLAVLSGHETYWRLVTGRGWRPLRYRRWLYRHCATDLIG